MAVSKQTFTVYLAATVRWTEEIMADSLADAAAQAQKFENAPGALIKTAKFGSKCEDWEKPEGATDYVYGVFVK